MLPRAIRAACERSCTFSVSVMTALPSWQERQASLDMTNSAAFQLQVLPDYRGASGIDSETERGRTLTFRGDY